MSPLVCMLLIIIVGGLGGAANVAFSGDGFVKPRWEGGVWCPGAIATIFIGAASALSSWALYGSGVAIDLAQGNQNTQISLRLSALIGAFFVGAGGARWLTNETDKKLLAESVRVAGPKKLTAEQCDDLVRRTPRKILSAVLKA